MNDRHSDDAELQALSASWIAVRLLDGLAAEAADALSTPIGLLTLVGADAQVFIGKYGLTISETPRSSSFCAHTLAETDGHLVVPDALSDPRFAANPLVLGDPSIRFYAGKTIPSVSGEVVLCVIDRTVRPELKPADQAVLNELAERASALIELIGQRVFHTDTINQRDLRKLAAAVLGRAMPLDVLTAALSSGQLEGTRVGASWIIDRASAEGWLLELRSARQRSPFTGIYQWADIAAQRFLSGTTGLG